MTSTNSTTHPLVHRGLSLLGAGVIGVTLFGYVVGLVGGNSTVAPRVAAPAKSPVNTGAPAAPSYAELAEAKLGPNANWRAQLHDLTDERPSRLEPVTRTPQMKAAALADRALTRAFDGAPPVIPHRVEQQAAASCLVCHAQGMKLGDRIAMKISHAHYTNCTQCHVESQGNGPFVSEPETAPNLFTGVYRAGPGQRAAPGAPPTVPHATFLREDCLSCHGTLTRAGLRTTHPWLNNCTQCHAPAAELESFGAR